MYGYTNSHIMCVCTYFTHRKAIGRARGKKNDNYYVNVLLECFSKMYKCLDLLTNTACSKLAFIQTLGLNGMASNIRITQMIILS